MNAPLSGVYPIANTPFHSDGSIDYDSQDRLVDHLLAQGAHGLGLFGNASEGYTLSSAERIELMRRISKRVNGRVPLVASSGHTGTAAAVELSREMMPAPLLVRMGREIEQVRYVKVEAPPTATKITAIAKQAAGSLTLFGGLNCQFFIEEWQRGARGQMPGSDRTRDLVQIWEHLEQGRAADAWAVFSRILPLLRFELQPGLGVSAQKHNLVAAGVIACPQVRHPTAALDADSLVELAYLRTLADHG